ncbi:MAG TPA: VOC family protein [Dongiaceae bacterium]|nr:VOC family protein [Dongiaceae bacterium]
MTPLTQDVEVQAAPKSVVALLNVADVKRSISFYERLGFQVGNEPLKNDQGATKFVWMHHGNAAQIMLTLTGRPLNSAARGIMFYLYVTDMPAYREQLISRGVIVGEVMHPSWSPDGEFRVDDPDGWTWVVC